MTVTRTPGTDKTPMIKIANRTLDTMGFGIGAAIVVAYEKDRNVISISLKTKYESSSSTISKPRITVSAESAAAASNRKDAGTSV